MTVYRIDEELAEMLERDEGPSLGAIIRRGIQVGVLVPVEPDREEIEDALFDYAATSTLKRRDERVRIATARILAALGVGEETP